MIGMMPTRTGDVVVTHSAADPSRCQLWHVEADLQQTVSPSGYTSTACGLQAALKLAKMMGRESRGGAVFLRELDTLTWTKLSD